MPKAAHKRLLTVMIVVQSGGRCYHHSKAMISDQVTDSMSAGVHKVTRKNRPQERQTCIIDVLWKVPEIEVSMN